MAGKKILVIDDEAAIRKFLKASLNEDGYVVTEATNAREGLKELATSKPDLVILDLGLPDMDGYEVIKTARQWTQVPIVVLTVKDDEETKVKVLDAGADDYLTKPFGVPELSARLRAAWRHSPSSNLVGGTFQTGGLEVDLVSRVVKVAGIPVHLTVTEYNILQLLIKHAGRVVTHRQILKEVWGPNAVEQTQYLRVYLGLLRKKIEPDPGGDKIIVTEPGVGYRLLIS
jgi:two-component system KDP operon response regulator KdpE